MGRYRLPDGPSPAELAVPRERHTKDHAAVPRQGGQRPPAGRGPQLDRPVDAAAGQQPPIPAQRHAIDRAGVPLQGGEHLETLPLWMFLGGAATLPFSTAPPLSYPTGAAVVVICPRPC